MTREKRVLMLGTFGLRPKGTMSARAVGLAGELQQRGWQARIATVPWDCPEDAGRCGRVGGVDYRNASVVRPSLWPIAVAELIREARRFQPHLIHLFKPKGFGDLAARYLKRAGYPVLVDMDDWEGTGGWNDLVSYSRTQRALFDWQERTWPSRADMVTVVSRTLHQRALSLGANPDRVTYLPNGLTRGRYEELAHPPQVPYGYYPLLATPGQRRILLYTRFVEFDPAFAVDILSRVAMDLPDAQLLVAGGSLDGSAEGRLMSSARRAGIADRITSLGWIDPRDLGWIAQRCRAAVVPFDDTLVNRSKCSVKLLELMACGLPIVASAVGENREYLGGGRYGLLARPGDPESHARLLYSYLNDCSEYRSHSDKARSERVRTNHLWDQLSETALSAYYSVESRF